MKELAQLQSTHRALEQQMSQTHTKMTQEIQQAKKDSNILQSDIEKVKQTEFLSSLHAMHLSVHFLLPLVYSCSFFR